MEGALANHAGETIPRIFHLDEVDGFDGAPSFVRVYAVIGKKPAKNLVQNTLRIPSSTSVAFWANFSRGSPFWVSPGAHIYGECWGDLRVFVVDTASMRSRPLGFRSG